MKNNDSGLIILNKEEEFEENNIVPIGEEETMTESSPAAVISDGKDHDKFLSIL